MATVAAALLDASRRLSENPDLFKDASSTGNMSMGSSSSFSSGNEVCRAVRMFSRNNDIFTADGRHSIFKHNVIMAEQSLEWREKAVSRYMTLVC